MKDNEWKKRNCRGQIWSELERNIRAACLNEGRIGETLGECRRELVEAKRSRGDGCGIDKNERKPGSVEESGWKPKNSERSGGFLNREKLPGKNDEAEECEHYGE